MVSDARRGSTALVTLKRLNTYAYMYDRQNAAARLRYITLAELNSPTGRMPRDFYAALDSVFGQCH